MKLKDPEQVQKLRGRQEESPSQEGAQQPSA
jgi:hypothetical protein